MPIDINQISFAGGVVSPSTYARLDLQKFGSSAKELTNYFVHAEGGISNRAGTEFVVEVKDSTQTVRKIPFEFNEEQAYSLEFGNQYMRVVRDGGLVLEASQVISGATQANPVVITSTGHTLTNGDEVYIAGIVGMTELNGKYFTVANTTANTFELSGIDGTAYTAYTSGGTVSKVFELATPYLQSELAALKYRQSNDIMYLAHRNHAPRKLGRTGHASWTLTTIVFTPEQVAITGMSVANIGTTGSTTYTYRVTAVSDETAEESLITEANTTTGNATLSDTNYNRITFTAASGAVSYNVYKEDNGLYGFIGRTETTTFNDKNLSADLNDTAPKLRQPFNASGDYPGAVGLHEQRSVWGNTDNKPLTTEMSQTGQFENMNVSSPTKESDAVSLRLVTGQGNEIRHYRSFANQLFTFTSGAVWTVQPGGNVDAITPSSKKVSVSAYISSTDTPPLTIKENILMVSGKQNEGFEVHSLGFDLQTDGYKGSDLTVLARHLFENKTITEWAYAERPYRLLVCVRSDGKLLVMTYLQEHQVFAWSIWDTDGTFESVSSVPEGQEDVFYFVVKRTINGNDVKYIERMHTRNFTTIEDAFFVDSGLTLDNPTTISGATQANPVVVTATAHPFSNGDKVKIRDVVGMTELNTNNLSFTVANTTANTFELSGVDGTTYSAYVSGGTAREEVSVITGLDHLEGKDVIALADGNLVTSTYESATMTVTNGSIDIGNAASIVHVGLPYTGTFESLPLNVTMQSGPSIAKLKIPKEMVVRVKDTRGIFMGSSIDNLDEYASRSTELWGDPASVLNDVIRLPISADWNRDTGVVIQSEPGLPQTILSVTPSTNIGG